jgi:hypothetical protein
MSRESLGQDLILVLDMSRNAESLFLVLPSAKSSYKDVERDDGTEFLDSGDITSHETVSKQ